MRNIKDLERRARRSWQICLGSLLAMVATMGLVVLLSPATAGAWTKILSVTIVVFFLWTFLTSGYVAVTAGILLDKRRRQLRRFEQTEENLSSSPD